MQGVVAIFVCKLGHIIETVADFEKGGAAGISQKDNQRYRAKYALTSKVVRAYCSPNLTDNISNYTYERIFNDLLENGAKVHYEYVGYEKEQQ